MYAKVAQLLVIYRIYWCQERTFNEQQRSVRELNLRQLVTQHREQMVNVELKLLERKHQRMRCKHRRLRAPRNTQLIWLVNFSVNIWQKYVYIVAGKHVRPKSVTVKSICLTNSTVKNYENWSMFAEGIVKI